MNRRWRTALILGVLLALTSLIGAAVYSRSSKQKVNQKIYRPADVTVAPPVVSKVKDLQIVEVRLVNQGTPHAALAIDVTNHRDSAVMSLDFISGSSKEYSGIAMDGLLEEDNPIVAIPPHTLKTFTWSLGEIMVGETVFLAAAIFADGKEEGDKRSLDGIHKTRARYQLQQREAKAKKGGQQ